MKRRTPTNNRRLRWSLCCTGAFLAVLPSALGQTYSVQGTLPHQARAINASGQVAGSDSFDGSTTHAALYSNFQLTDLGTLGGDFSEGVAINGSGQVVGDSTLSNGLTHATLWSNGQIIDLWDAAGGQRRVMPPGSMMRVGCTGWSDTLQPGTSSPPAGSRLRL